MRTTTACFALLCFAFLLVATRPAEARPWMDRKGRQLEAEFVEFAEGKVQLKRISDGKLVSVPLERLSDDDQAFVRSRTQAVPSPPKADARLSATKTASGDAKPVVLPASAQKVWEQAKAAQLVVQFGGVLTGAPADVKFDEQEFPPIPHAAQRMHDHLNQGVEAARKKDFKLARRRGIAEASLGVSSSEWILYVFADSEDDWPQSSFPLKLRVHGLRLSTAKVSALVEMSLGNVPLPSVDDDALERELTKLVADLKAGGKEARDNYDMVLVGERIDAAGIVHGKATGTFTDGSKLREASFRLTPLTIDGQRIPVSE